MQGGRETFSPQRRSGTSLRGEPTHGPTRTAHPEADDEPFIIPGNAPKPKPTEAKLENSTIRDSALPHAVTPGEPEPQGSTGNGSASGTGTSRG